MQVMTSSRNILVLVSSLILVAASCTKDDSTSPSAPIDGDLEYVSVPLSITVGIAPLEGSIVGMGGKQTFSAGDVIVISNPDVLYESLALSTEGCEGMASAQFATELKVRKDAELVSGSTKLSAVLKNGDLYNHGKQFVDVKKIPSLAEGMEKYGSWSCDSFAYSTDGNAVTLEQSTVFLDVNLFGTTLSMQYGVASYSEIISSACLYALPSGIVVECNSLNIRRRLDAKEKSLYRIEYPAPEQCLPGCFSIGEGKSVFFSKGNLQYRPMDGSWRVAPQQYLSCFEVNGETVVGENYSEWMGEDKWTDIFRWGAFMEGGSPGTTTQTYDYDAFVGDDGRMKGVCAYGTEWTILDQYEWYYLFEQRPDALQKRGGALVGGILGWVILPDDWSTPEGIAPFVGQYKVKYNKDLPNNYTFDEWEKMELAGAVFLPQSGNVYINGKHYEDCLYNSMSFEYQSRSYSDESTRDWYDEFGGFTINFVLTSSICSYNTWWVYEYKPVRLVQKMDATKVKTK